MKTYGFNLLPQKSKALVRKETKRDNYSVAIAILPLIGVLLWLGLILINYFVFQPQKDSVTAQITADNKVITEELAPILIKNGEVVTKTNALATVITRDIQPEELFKLVDQIYANQDPTFKITGYSRNSDGSFSVNISAVSYTRFAEIVRRFKNSTNLEQVTMGMASLDEKTNMVSGSIIFFLNVNKNANPTK